MWRGRLRYLPGLTAHLRDYRVTVGIMCSQPWFQRVRTRVHRQRRPVKVAQLAFGLSAVTGGAVSALADWATGVPAAASALPAFLVIAEMLIEAEQPPSPPESENEPEVSDDRHSPA